MNGSDWLEVAANHWPWLLVSLGLVAFIIYGAKAVAAVRDSVWLPMVAYMRRSSLRERQRVDAELDDLRRQVQYLEGQITDLRSRDEMSWAWILSDQEWHRTFEFMATENGWKVPPRISFMDFREKWVSAHHIKATPPETAVNKHYAREDSVD